MSTERIPDFGKGGRAEGALEVEVACAEPLKQVVKRVSVAPGTTIREVVMASGLDADFPDLAIEDLDIGVFGRRMDPETCVRPGDRVELYRPLLTDPKEGRRSRARAQSASRRKGARHRPG